MTQAKPLNVRAVVGGLLAFLVIFGGGVLLVAKGDTAVDAGAAGIVAGVLANLSDYALQGPVLFSRYFTGAAGVDSTWDALVFPCSMLQRLDLCKAGELHQQFAEFGRFDQFGNVYTVYFAILPKYGWVGLLAILGSYGAWASFHHRRHRQHGSLPHAMLAAFLFSAVVLSIFSDLFAPNLNFLLKTAFAAWLLQLWARSAARAA